MHAASGGTSSGKPGKKGAAPQNPVDCHPLVNHMAAVTSVCFTADAARCVSVSRDKVSHAHLCTR